MRLTTRRILATTISAALLVTACSSGDDDADSTTTAAPTTTGAPETTAAPETTTTTEAPPTTPAPTTTPTTQPAPTTSPTTEPAPTTQPPPTTNPGDPDWVAIVQDLLATYNDIQENPDVDRIEEFCLGGENLCQDVQGEEVRQFVENGWRVEGIPVPTVLRAEVIDSTDELPEAIRQYVLRVETDEGDISDAAVVDLDGEKLFGITSDLETDTRIFNIRIMPVNTEWRVLGIASVEQ